MLTSLMLAPAANTTYVTSSGQTYTSDNASIIKNIQSRADQTDLVAAGCAILTPPPTDLLFSLKNADFNSTADQILTPTFNGKFRIRRVTVQNASISLTTAAGGLYTAASKGGSAIVAAGQAYSSLTGALLALDCTIALPALVLAAATPLYLSLTTAQGAAATADIDVYGDVYT